MVASFDLIGESQRSLFESADDLMGALVYVDAAFSQLARDAWGVKQLLGTGAVNVCRLETAAAEDLRRSEVLSAEPIAKVVVFTGRLLHDCYSDLVALLAWCAPSGVRSCAVFTTMAEETYSALSPPQMSLYPFESFREKLLSQLRAMGIGAGGSHDGGEGGDRGQDQGQGGAGIEVEVKSCPLVFCPQAPKVFTIPTPPGHLQEQLRAALDFERTPFYRGDDFDVEDHDGNVPPSLGFLSRQISDMCQHLGWEANLYAQGRVAKVVARAAAAMDRSSKAPALAERPSVSFIVLDRLLDLATPLCHADSNLERVMALGSCGGEGEGDSAPAIAPSAGSLAQPTDRTAAAWFEGFCSEGARDTGFSIRKELKEALLAERIPLSPEAGTSGDAEGDAEGAGGLGAISTEELARLKGLVESSKDRKQRHASLLRYAELAIAGTARELCKKSDLLVAIEQVVASLALEGPDVPMQYLVELVSKIKDETLIHLLSADDVGRLTFVAHVLVSLKFGRAGQELNEALIQDFLTDLFLLERIQRARAAEAAGKSPESSEGQRDEEEVKRKVAAILAKLKRATAVSCKLNEECGAPLLGLQDEFSPLVASVLDESRAEAAPLQHMPASIGGLLASGLGRRFGFQSHPTVGEADMIVVFVLGPLSPLEIKWAARGSDSGKPVLIGGLDICSPENIFAHFLL